MAFSSISRLRSVFSANKISVSKLQKPIITTRPCKPEDKKFETIVTKFKTASRLSHSCMHGRATYATTVSCPAHEYNEYDLIENQKQYKDIETEDCAIRVMDLYAESGMFGHACNLFNDMSRLKCERTVKSFNALLAACVKCKEFDNIVEIFSRVPEELKIKRDHVSYTTFMESFFKKGELDNATRYNLIRKLMEYPVTDNLLEKDNLPKKEDTWSEDFAIWIMGFYGESGMFGHAHKFFDDMPMLKCERTVKSFNALLAACVKCKEFVKIVDIFARVPKELRIGRDHVSYTTFMEAFCEMGELDNATKYNLIEKIKKYPFEDILTDNLPKETDIWLEDFAIWIMSFYGESGMFGHASKLFNKMPKLKWKRTMKSFCALLAACVKCKEFEKISDIFSRAPEELDIYHDIVSCNTVMKALCDEDEFDTALLILEEMEKNGVEPNLITFNILFDWYEVYDRFSDCEKVWEKMREKNIVPNFESYNPKFRTLTRSHRFSEAVELIEEMKRGQVVFDSNSYNSLIRGFCHGENLEQAKKWFIEMEENGFKSDNVSYLMIGSLACRTGDFNYALELFKKATNEKHVTHEALGRCVLHYLVESDRFSEALELIEEIKKGGIELDAIIYKALIERFCYHENMEQAKKLFEKWCLEMGKNGCELDRTTYLMKGHTVCNIGYLACKIGDFDYAFELCKNAIDEKLDIHMTLGQLVVDGLVKESKIEKAKELVKIGKRYYLEFPKRVQK